MSLKKPTALFVAFLLAFCLLGCKSKSVDNISQCTNAEQGLQDMSSVTQSSLIVNASSNNTASKKVSSKTNKTKNSSSVSSKNKATSSIKIASNQTVTLTPDASTETLDISHSYSPSTSDSSAKIKGTPIPKDSRWYYSHLNAAQKVLYNKVEAAAENMTSGLIDLGKCDDDTAVLIGRAVSADRPDLFWISSSYIILTKSDGNSAVAYDYSKDNHSTSYNISKSERAAMQAQLNSVVASIAKGINSNMSEYEAVLYLHNWLCENLVYDINCVNDPLAHTAYGALVSKKVICEGYSKAMQYLCNYFGIECHLVYGKSLTPQSNNQETVGHMWNQVKIGGKFCNIDVTWDDNSTVGATHSYFGLNDSEMQETHSFDKDFYNLSAKDKIGTQYDFNFCLPSCQTKQFQYTNINHLELSNDIDESQQLIAVVLIYSIKQGKKFCEFHIDKSVAQKPDINTFVDKYNIQKCLATAIKATGKNLAVNLYFSGRSYIITW